MRFTSLSLERLLGAPRSPRAWIVFFVVVILAIWLGMLCVTTFPPQPSLDIVGNYSLFVRQRGVYSLIGYGPDNRMFVVWLGYILLVVATLTGEIIRKIKTMARNPLTVTNARYWIFATALTFFVVTFDGASNFYNWYDPSKMITYGIGGIDVFTHSLAGITFGLLLGPYNWEILIQANRRTAFFILWLAGLIPQEWWEWRENLRPETYLNPRLNSFQDVFLFMIGVGFSLFLYEVLVEELGF